jgi:hypothetical protein
MNRETCLIGISNCNKKGAIGPTVYSMVVVKTDFFRQFPWIKQTDSIQDINKSVELTNKYVEQFEVFHTDPKESEDRNTEIKAIINLLNRRHKFWKDKIYIQTDIPAEEFKSLFEEAMPKNLRIANLQLNKWTIESNYKNNRLVTLSNLYARYSYTIEANMIRGVWGDFGKGLPDDPKLNEFLEANPECPHIKLKYRKVQP